MNEAKEFKLLNINNKCKMNMNVTTHFGNKNLSLRTNISICHRLACMLPSLEVAFSE